MDRDICAYDLDFRTWLCVGMVRQKEVGVMSNLIDRQTVIDAIDKYIAKFDCIDVNFLDGLKTTKKILNDLPSVQSEQQWIPIKTRPMTDEEKDYYSDILGVDPEYYGGYMFDCQMPEDKQRVWVQTKNGYIFDDVCEVDDGISLEGNGDWDDIVAWMPMFVPKPWEGEGND